MGKTELTQADLKGQAYEVVKAFYPDVVQLQFQIEECYKMLTYQIDWANPEGDQDKIDISKPLPLSGPPSHALSISKMKAARYHDFGLELLKFYIDRHTADSSRKVVRTHMRILSVVRIKAYSRYGYDYLKEITLHIADYQEYTIIEKDFKNLYPSNFEDLNLLLLQGQLNHLSGSDKRMLSTKQLNLTKPGWDAKGFEYKHDYTIIESPRAVVFPINNNEQKIMRFNEIYKFSDGTLTNILEALDYRVKEYKVNRLNPGMNMQFWTDKDVARNKEFKHAIKQRLKTRRIFRNLECFVGGRNIRVIPKYHNEDGNPARANIKQALGKAKKSVKLMMEKLFRMELELMLVTQKSDGFEQIVDFLNAHLIWYALTINPTIYISCIKQFWSTVKVKTINGEAQLHALVDGKKLIIIESSVRRDLQLEDEEGVDCLPNSTIFKQLTLMGPKTNAWNEFCSTMASAIICLATNQTFIFLKFIFESMVRNLENLSGKVLMYPRVTSLFPTMVVQNQSKLGEGLAIPTDPYHTPTIIQPSTQPQKTQKPGKPKRKDTQVPQSSDPSENVANEAVHKELGDSLVRAATTASSLEPEHDSGKINKTQSKATPNESSSLETTSGGGPRINAIDADEEITLVSVQNVDEEIFDVNVLDGEKVFVTKQEVIVKEVNDEVNVVEEVVEVINSAKLIIDVAQVSAAGNVVSIAGAATTVSAAITTIADDITLAQVLEEMKSTKPKVKGVVIQELGEFTTTKSSQLSSQQSQDKGKGIWIEPEKLMKKKDQISFDEETALKLQAEFDEEERLTREKSEKEKEANIVLIKTWDNIQAKINADHQLAERLQAQEQEELSVEEKATLFQQLLEKRRKHFTAKRA
ncbi:hypothetical protein Tco_0073176 [Tanacetum coccineum]